MAKKQPYYLQIREDILNKIESGEWAEGDLIPPELELAKRYNVSRVTIRKAIVALVNEQYLIRRAGYGTTVFKNKSSLSHFTFIQSFTNEMNEIGIPSKTMNYELKMIEADHLLASIFKIPVKSKLYNLRRLRGAEMPILFSDTYLIPVIEIPDDSNILNGSLYRFLADNNVLFSKFDEFVSAVNASSEIKDLLQIVDDSPQLKRKRFSYDQNNRLIEYTETYYNSKLYEYRARLYYRKS